MPKELLNGLMQTSVKSEIIHSSNDTGGTVHCPTSYGDDLENVREIADCYHEF